MTNVHSNIWQIYILTDTGKNIPVTINKNESVSDLFKKFREKHRGFQREKRLTLLPVDGPELQENDRRSLIDVDCLRDMCNIQLIVHVDGGGWPTESEVELKIRDPTKVPSLSGRITNSIPDIMGLDDETPRVKMSCGHVIAPSSLALHCYWELQDGAQSIRCPDPDCDTVWSFKSVIDAACLSSNEINEFERRILSNKLDAKADDIKKCPGCETSCRRSNNNDKRIRCKKCTSDKSRNFDFCWSCLKEWRNSRKALFCGNLGCGDHTFLFECLANCDTKILNGMECPSRRACPECLTLIEHIEKCKHVKCPNKRCNHNFCFTCLQKYPCETGLTGAHKPCTLAPRQQSTCPPLPPSPKKCAIL